MKDKIDRIDKKQKILHLLVSGGIGGIEVLMRDYARFSCHEHIFLFAWGGGKVAEQIRQAGSEVIILSREEWNLRKLCRIVITLCKEQKVTALVVHNAAPALRCVLLAVRFSGIGVQTIAYAHSDASDIIEQDRRGWRIRKSIYGCSFILANRVVVISHWVEKSLYHMWKIPHGKIKVIYNGVEINRFCCSEKTAHDPLRLLFVGRLTKSKGVQIILDALTQVDCPEKFQLTIVGDGAFRRELENQAQRLHLMDRVHFCGKRDDVPQYMIEADVFIHVPQWEEGFGLTVVEAMASGLLCVCGEKGALPEIITDGENGILLRETTAEALAKCLNTLSKQYNSQRMRTMRRNAAVSVQNFSVQKFTEEMDAFLGQ